MKTILLILCLVVPLALSGYDNVPLKKTNVINAFSTNLKKANSQQVNMTKINVDSSKFSSKEKNWFYQPKKDGTPSGEPKEVLDLIGKNSSYYLGDTSSKIIYLTFDEGYENGFTGKILDILKENKIKAAFL